MAQTVVAEQLSDVSGTEISNGNNLINATQNAIIDAAENVSEVFDKANPDIANPIVNEPFYADVEFWVGVAFILSVIVIAKPVLKIVKQVLQKNIDAVIAQIDDAVKLRDDAQKTLAEYEKKFAHTDEEVAQIVKQAQKNINNFKKREMQKLQEAMELKEKEIQNRIDTATEKVRADINQKISDMTATLARNVIEKYLKKADKSKLIDETINELDKLTLVD